MSFELAEHDRRIANAIALGTIAELDAAKALVRVDVGDLKTDWLPWLTARAGQDRTWWAPDIGEQCLVLSPSGEMSQGVVLLGLYLDDHPAPAADPDLHLIEYKDGTKLKYDRAAGILTVDCVGDVVVKGARTLLVDFQGDITVKSATQVTVDAPATTITGTLHVQGAVTIDAGMTSTGDVTADGVSLESHTHGGVQGGSSHTGPPG